MPGTTSTALSSFSHDQNHKTDAAKRKGGEHATMLSIQHVLGLPPRHAGLTTSWRGLTSRVLILNVQYIYSENSL